MRSAPLWGRAQAQAGRLRSRISIGRIGAVGSIRKRSPDMDPDGIAVFLYPSLGPVSRAAIHDPGLAAPISGPATEANEQ
jgi:hypothetical protein